MSVAVAQKPRVLHAVSGRVRLHVPGWSGQGKRLLETQLRQMRAVRSVQANTLTGNMLITFDPTVTSEQAILQVVRKLDLETINKQEHEPPPAPAVHEKQGKTVRARIAVRGIDRDPHLARRVVEHLEHHPGVHAHANPLTGRVLMEFTEHEADLDDLIAEVTGMELPELPGEGRPAHPLDPGPLIQSASRTIGAALGLGPLAVRTLFGVQESLPGAGAALQASSVIGILQGIPPIRFGLRKLVGHTAADLIFNVPGIITLTLAGSPLGLALTGGESLRLLTFLLLTVILGTATNHKLVGHNAALAVSGTIALAGLFAAPISGASMNPARSLGPFLVAGQLADAWIYVVGPFTGGLLAVVVAWLLRGGTTRYAVEAASGE